MIFVPIVAYLIFGATQISLSTIVAAAVALATGAGTVFGWQSRQQDKAAAIWKGLAEAREAETHQMAHELAEMKARVDMLTSEWAKELVRQIIRLVEQEHENEHILRRQ